MTQKRSKIVGLAGFKNKVNHNAFDLSHRNMFTANTGELLPILCQWVNPNETFKIKYDGFTRSSNLQTAAFTRIRENVQYYFVPFQSLWRYFNESVNNMTKGQSGEVISKTAQSLSDSTELFTGMPYINYSDLQNAIDSVMLATANRLLTMATTAKEFWNTSDYAKTFMAIDYQLAENSPNTRLRRIHYFTENDTFKYVSMCKLFSSLGYGNFPLMSYDMLQGMMDWLATNPSDKTVDAFQVSIYGWYSGSDWLQVKNAPNLSVFPLLAYHKIVEDHYRYRQWQPYRAWTCNIDFINPSSLINMYDKLPVLGDNKYHTLFDMEYSNLPLDYLNGVLPTAQFGDESSVVVGGSSSADVIGSNCYAGIVLRDPYVITASSEVTTSAKRHFLTDVNAATRTEFPICLDNGSVDGNRVSQLNGHSNSSLDFKNAKIGTVDLSDNGFKISALRNALALQKYKEIQNANDTDFEEQVLAHFGIKPTTDPRKARFIGGGDSTLTINPQVNQNLTGDNDADIKAIGTGSLHAECKFKSDTYGLIIGIYRVTPQLDYSRTMIDRNLLKTDAADFPVPELDSIGMQTQYRFEVDAPSLGISRADMDYFQYSPLDMSKTYGYLPRYAHLKTSFDRFDGAFKTSLRSWVTGLSSVIQHRWSSVIGDDKGPTYQPNLETAADLLPCRAEYLYPIFVDQLSSTVDHDKFFVGSVNTVVAVRPFSTYGLPYLK